MCEVPEGALGVAVSGGGDSIALLRLLAEWTQRNDRLLYVATVNHNLRPEAVDEAVFVGQLCANIGLKHTTLEWNGWVGKGNLQSTARNARKTLLAKWAADLEITTIALGHTQDDQAETFLMRLARGSGVDGLSGIQHINGEEPIWVRPLLNIPRAVLRDYLTSLDQVWIDDPSNDDTKFDRVKMRNALPILAELGLTSERLAQTAQNLQLPRKALEQLTQVAAYRCCLPNKYGVVEVNLEQFSKEPLDIQYRLLSCIMAWVSGAEYRPRFDALKTIHERILSSTSQTLGGCFFKPTKDGTLHIMRELSCLPKLRIENVLYDNRWLISADHNDGLFVGPLGDKGLPQIQNWRELNVIRDVLLQTPAIWEDETVIVAPLLASAGNETISLKTDPKHFYKSIVSH